MSKKGRDTSRRVQEMRAAQRRAEQRRRSLVIGGVAIAAIALIVGIGIAVQSNRDQTGAVVDPNGVVDSFGIARGDAGAPVTIDLYEDFQCPICKNYEGWLGDTITQDIDDGTLRVVYRPMAFLNDYSKRALETAACVLDEDGAGAYFKLHDLLYQNQPSEQGPWPSDADLSDLAVQAGATGSAVDKCQSNGTFSGWVKAATDAASKAHVTATPTYLLGGQEIPVTSAQTQQDAITVFQNAVDAAAQGAGASSGN
jgi:protein-disulfide isomerase